MKNNAHNTINIIVSERLNKYKTEILQHFLIIMIRVKIKKMKKILKQLSYLFESINFQELLN